MTDDKDTPRRSLRAHKDVDYSGKSVFAAKEEESEIVIPKGVGSQLSELECWKSTKPDQLTLLHRLVFNRNGIRSERKKNLNQFCGFDPKNSEKSKLEERISKQNKNDIVMTLKALGLKSSGNVKELSEALSEFLMKPDGKKADGSTIKSKASPQKGKAASPQPIIGSKRKKELNSSDLHNEETPAKRTKGNSTTPEATSKKSSPGKKNPSKKDLTSWVTKALSSKTSDEITSIKLNEFRNIAERHFGLSDGSLKDMKDTISIAIRKYMEAVETKRVGSLTKGSMPNSLQPTPEPSVMQPDTNDYGNIMGDREGSLSRTGDSAPLPDPV